MPRRVRAPTGARIRIKRKIQNKGGGFEEHNTGECQHFFAFHISLVMFCLFEKIRDFYLQE